MEKKIYNSFFAYSMAIFLCMPLVLIVLSAFRTGSVDFTECFSICNTFKIPFVLDACNDLASLLDLAENTLPVVWFAYYISLFVYYLCIEVFLIALTLIHNLFHLAENKISRGLK